MQNIIRWIEDIMITKICKQCNKEFKVHPYRKDTAMFCSRRCSTIFRNPLQYVKPENRNISGLRPRIRGEYHHSLESKVKIGKNTPKYSGEKHWNWKGGITEKNRGIRLSLEYEIWRSEVYKRDNWTCRLCEKHCQRKNIIAHHLNNFADYPELRFNINNGLTLCRECHIKLHRPGDNNIK